MLIKRKPPAGHRTGIDRDAQVLETFTCNCPVELVHGHAPDFLAFVSVPGFGIGHQRSPYLHATCRSRRRFRIDAAGAKNNRQTVHAGCPRHRDRVAVYTAGPDAADALGRLLATSGRQRFALDFGSALAPGGQRLLAECLESAGGAAGLWPGMIHGTGRGPEMDPAMAGVGDAWVVRGWRWRERLMRVAALGDAGTAQQVLQGRSFAGGRPDPVLVSGKDARGRRAVPPAARGLRRRRDRGADGGRGGCRRGETVGLGGPEAGIRSSHVACHTTVAVAVASLGRPGALDGGGPGRTGVVKPAWRQALEEELAAARVAEEVARLEVAADAGLFEADWTRATLAGAIGTLTAGLPRKPSRSAQLARWRAADMEAGGGSGGTAD